MNIPFSNSGTIEVQSGTLAFNGGFTQTDGELKLDGGNVSANSAMDMSGGALTGSGTVSATVNMGGTVIPGSATTAGQLTVNGGFNMSASAKLAIGLGGATPATGFDVVQVYGTMILDGALELAVLNGFTPAGGDNFAIAQATTLSGAFANVASGQRLSTPDGQASFLVYYGAGSPFPANQVILTGFEACEAPLISGQPAPQTVCPNTQVLLTVAATGGNLTYQWIKDGNELTGETDATLTINSMQAAQAGDYQVRVQNSCGVELSAVATLSVVDNPPALALNGQANVTIESCTDDYIELGGVASADCDGTLMVVIGGESVNTSTPGTYVVTYSATDSSSQTAQVSRTVVVQDTIAPTFTATPSDLTLDCSATDKESQIQAWLSSVTASDSCGSVTVSHDFGTLSGCDAGAKVVTWTASDSNGNTATVLATLTITADGQLSELSFQESPHRANVFVNTQEQITITADSTSDCPIIIESLVLSGPELGPLLTISNTTPQTVCPGDSINLQLDVDTSAVVPGKYPYVITWQGPSGEISSELELVVLEAGLPDLTANTAGGGLRVIPAVSPTLPAAVEDFTVQATIFNIGTIAAGDFAVRFFEGANLLGVVPVSGFGPGNSAVVEFPISGGRPEGFCLFRTEIIPPSEGEVSVLNNESSVLLQVGAFPVGTATLVVRANPLPACDLPTQVFVTGIAEYEITSTAGVVRYPVKGGAFSLQIIGNGVASTGHTLVDGTFSGYVPVLEAGIIDIVARVSDATLIGQAIKTVTIPSVNCPAPGGVEYQAGEPSPKFPSVSRNLFVCNGDFLIRASDCFTPVLRGSVPLGTELCLGLNVHYYETNALRIPEQPVYLTAFEQVGGEVVPYPIGSTAVSFVGGGVAEAKFTWTPPHGGTFILQAQLTPTFPQAPEDDMATTTIVVGGPAEPATEIKVTAQGQNLCSRYTQSISGRAVYSTVPGDARPVICGDVLVSVYSDDLAGGWQLLGTSFAQTDRFGNFSLHPWIALPPGQNLFAVSVTDGHLIGTFDILTTCEAPPVAGEPSVDTPPDAISDVFVYSEDIGFLRDNCQNPLLGWPRPGDDISIFANIRYFGPEPGPTVPVDVSVLLPVGNQLIRQLIGTVEVSDWNAGGQVCLPWTPLAVGPQIVEVATRPDLVPLNQFTGNDAATRLVFVGEVDCQLTTDQARLTVPAGAAGSINVSASRVAGDGSMHLSIFSTGDQPEGLVVQLTNTILAVSETAVLTFLTTADTPPGLYHFIVVGNADTCQAVALVDVRVIPAPDMTPPTINCPTIVSVFPADNTCSAIVSDLAAAAEVSDNYSAVENIMVMQSPAAGATLGLGTHVITLTATDEAGNSTSCETTLTVVDTTAPVVTLLGDASIVVECHSAFLDPGATAGDACAGSLPVSMTGLVDVNTPGTYLLTYSAIDPAGNSSGVTRTVSVVDTTAPFIVLLGEATIVVECHGSFTDPGATAADLCSGDLTGNIAVSGSVDTTSPGDYVLTYSVADASGNPAIPATRTVSVRDTTPPTITCPAPLTLSVGANCEAILPNLVAGTIKDDLCSPTQITMVQQPVAGTSLILGEHTVTLTATDASGNEKTCNVTVTVIDAVAPGFTCPAPLQLIADSTGEAVLPDMISQIAAGDCSGPVTIIQTPIAGTLLSVGSYSVLVTATDALGNASECYVTVTVTTESNTPPVVAIEQPTSGLISANNQAIQFVGSFTDDGPAGTHTAQWIISSASLPATSITGTVSGFTVSNSLTFPEAGVYSIKLVVTDAQGASGEATKVLNDLPAYVVIYDPSGGFVTGGGWIWSPPGAFHPDLSEFEPIEGRANFGFVSKYKKGGATPTGQTEFQFQAGDLNFHSASYQWLVVSGARAQFKGDGTVNNSGDFGFLLTAIDGQLNGGGDLDRFRIKIWDVGTGLIIYDNQPNSDDDASLLDTTTVRGGNIMIHKGK